MKDLTSTKIKKIIKTIRAQLQQYFKKNNLQYAIFGKSMGIDSSVIAALLSNLPGVRPIGVIIPIDSDPEDEQIAKIVLDHFNIPSLKVNLTEEYKLLASKIYNRSFIKKLKHAALQDKNVSLIKKLKERKKYALGNIKARLRMIAIYHIAQLTGGMVIGSSNYSEWWTGFWTLHGDVGDFYPIAEIFKGEELYAIAKELKIPKESLNAIPSDGLKISSNNTDEDQLGLPYQKLDKVLKCIIARKSVNEALKITGFPEIKIKQVYNQVKKTKHKRHHPIKITRNKLGLK